MKIGMFPGQLEALREEAQRMRQVERARSTRLAFLGLVIGGFAGIAGTLGLRGSGKQGEETATEQSPDLDWARNLAMAPTEELLAKQVRFVKALCQAKGRVEGELEVGLTRLAHLVVERDPRAQPGVGAAIEYLADEKRLPRHLELWATLIRSQRR